MYDDQNTSENQNQTTDLLRRLDNKFCSYCLENNYRLPRTHSDNECLHPQLKDKHKRVSEYGNKLENTGIHLSPMKYAKSLGHLTPDVALYDQGSDVTHLQTRSTHQRETTRYTMLLRQTEGENKINNRRNNKVNLEYKNSTIN